MTQRKNRKVYTKQDDPAPQPDFYGASDIMKLFDREPARLVDYLETAMERKNVVPTFHAMQFAKKIGMAFVSEGKPLAEGEMLEHSHVAPANFENIGAMLAMARMKFSHPPV